MARCFCYAIALFSLCVTAADGSDRPPKSTFRETIQGVLDPQTPQPIALGVAYPVAQAEAPEPIPPADALSPVEHLRRAADHLEAAAVGPIAEDVHRQAERLRELADEIEEEATAHLSELRQQLEKIQDEIRQLEALTQGARQIQVDLKLVEVDLSGLRRMALDLKVMGLGDLGNANGTVKTHPVPQKDAAVFLDALIEKGVAEVLASPTLITTSGRPATVHSGGEFPIPVPQNSENVSIQWREFGVRAEVRPVILDNGKVRLDIAPEISERDFTNAVTIEGMVVPGITVRRVNAQIEMEFGQTMVVGGLTSHASDQSSRAVQGAPVPGHDRLFKRVAHEETPNEKTLIILVTPTLVSHKGK